jgi:TRAP-type mannitol/chloroaromatic compound transport system permease small subunit
LPRDFRGQNRTKSGETKKFPVFSRWHGNLPRRKRIVRKLAVRILLELSRLIDGLNERVGRAVYWLILAAVLVSAGNATVRYLFDMSSNGWLELQWYLFSAVFLLAAGYTLRHNEHVRIDLVFTRLPARKRAWIDLFGGVFFLLPMAIVIMALSWPVFMESYLRHEMSGDAGGLLRWPVKLLIPAGFLLLTLQAVSEIIKRIAFLRGLIPDPFEKHQDPVVEEILSAPR